MSIAVLGNEDIAILVQLVLTLIAIYGFLYLHRLTKWVGWLYFSASVAFVMARVLLIFLNVIQDLDFSYNLLSISSDTFRVIGIYTLASIIKKAFESGSVVNVLSYTESLQNATERLDSAQDKVDNANKDLEVARVTLNDARTFLARMLNPNKKD